MYFRTVGDKRYCPFVLSPTGGITIEFSDQSGMPH